MTRPLRSVESSGPSRREYRAHRWPPPTSPSASCWRAGASASSRSPRPTSWWIWRAGTWAGLDGHRTALLRIRSLHRPVSRRRPDPGLERGRSTLGVGLNHPGLSGGSSLIFAHTGAGERGHGALFAITELPTRDREVTGAARWRSGSTGILGSCRPVPWSSAIGGPADRHGRGGERLGSSPISPWTRAARIGPSPGVREAGWLGGDGQLDSHRCLEFGDRCFHGRHHRHQPEGRRGEGLLDGGRLTKRFDGQVRHDLRGQAVTVTAPAAA